MISINQRTAIWAIRLLRLAFFQLASAETSPTNLGPLTTTFRPPQTCFDTTAYFYVDNLDTTASGDLWGGVLAAAWSTFTIEPNPATSCYPRGFNATGSAILVSDYFSPGICPSGYTTAREDKGHSDGNRATCCPSGFSVGVGNCVKTPAGPVTAQATFTTTYQNPNPNTVTQGDVPINTDSYSARFSTPFIIWASQIKIRYKDTDFALVTSSPSVPSPTASKSEGNRDLFDTLLIGIGSVLATLMVLIMQ